MWVLYPQEGDVQLAKKYTGEREVEIAMRRVVNHFTFVYDHYITLVNRGGGGVFF